MLDMIGPFIEEQAGIDEGARTVDDWRVHMERFLLEAVDKPDYHVRVMLASGRPVGFVMCGAAFEPTLKKGRIGYIADVYVKPELRGHGAGRHLVEDAMGILSEMGSETVQLNVLAKNDDSVAFWEKMGFSTYMFRMKRDL